MAKRQGLLPDVALADEQGSKLDGLAIIGGPWTSRGPNRITRDRPPSNYDRASGRVLSLALGPPDTVEPEEKIYAGTAGGGIWRSINRGQEWRPLTDDMPSPSIGALAIHATNPRVIFAGTGEVAACQISCLYGQGIYKSQDAGYNWNQRGAELFRGAAVSAIAVNPDGRDTNHIFAATVAMSTPGLGPVSQGVAVSNDLGETWSYRPAGPMSLTGFPVTDLVIDGRGNLYAAVSGMFGCMAAGQRCGIWYSSDEAVSWTQISSGLPPTGGRIHKLALAHTTADRYPGHQTLYTVIGRNPVPPSVVHDVLGVYRTDNGGAENPHPDDPLPDPIGMTTWQLVGDNTAGGPCSLQDTGQNAWYNIYVGVDPSDETANTVFVGLTDIYWTDQAVAANCLPGHPTNWSNLTHVEAEFPGGANIHADQHAILFLNGTDILFGNDGGVYLSLNRGLTFHSANSDLQLAQFYGGALNPAPPAQLNRLLGGTQDNGLIQTPRPLENGWETSGFVPVPPWPPPPAQNFYMGDGAYVAIDYKNPQNWYGELPNGFTMRSMDGGATWMGASPGMPTDGALFAAPLVIDPVNPATLYSGHAHLWRTLNGMTSWSNIGPATAGISAIAVAPNDPNRVYVADIGGQIWVTTNARSEPPDAVVWTARGAPCPDPMNCPIPRSYVTGLAVDPTIPLIVYAVVNGFQQLHVLRSNDGGAHWEDRSAGLRNDPFQSVTVNPLTHTTLYAGTDRRVYVSSDSGASWRRLGAGLPDVPIFQMVPNATGNQLTVFTHGRGAWRAPDTVCEGACGIWGAGGTLASGRHAHTATLLADGAVLVAGGFREKDGLATAERYFPATGAWSPTGSLSRTRYGHTATLLADSTVLVVGGFGAPAPLATAERYNPSTGSWSAAGSMAGSRILHGAALLPDGSVMVIGGLRGIADLATAERYDPATGAWSALADMITARSEHTATALTDGTVLVAGGHGPGILATAERYDPATGAWRPTGRMSTARYAHTATLLADGTVLVVGGNIDGGYTATAERYDPFAVAPDGTVGVWSPAGSMSTVRVQPTATLLADGSVLVAGGSAPPTVALATAELYDPVTNSWSLTGSLAAARARSTATLLANGTVLVAGGFNQSDPWPAMSERYRPAVVPPGSEL